MTKRIEITGHSGNDRTVEVAVTGVSLGHDKGNEELAREAARTLYNTMPGHVWTAFVEMVNRLDKHDPYAGM